MLGRIVVFVIGSLAALLVLLQSLFAYVDKHNRLEGRRWSNSADGDLQD